MFELVAQGKTFHERWRKVLLQKIPFVLGRTAKDWPVAWDEKISRKHAQLELVDNKLKVKRIPESSNPIYVRGDEKSEFSIAPGEHFVIGDTTFLLCNDSAFATLESPLPISQRAFSPEFLRHVQYQDADHRIECLNRLPEIISTSNNTDQLHGQMVNLLLSGITAASEVAICRRIDDGDTEVIAWDKRGMVRGDFYPSATLIEQAVTQRESILHLWRGNNDSDSEVTQDLSNDWAFVCPLNGPSNKGWAIYVAGINRSSGLLDDSEAEVSGIQQDVKFAELVGATLANLRRVQQLERRQSTFRPFFSPIVMEAFVDRDPEEVLQPRECEISVLFCDLRGFSAKSEEMSEQLEELLDRVSQALGIMTKSVLDFGGVIGDFHGDSAMGFWGWPLEKSDAADNACQAALRIQSELAAIASQADHPLKDFHMGIGVATGNAVAGKIGTSHQVKVTAFGPVVNLAARMEGMTRQLNIPILIDGNTTRQVNSAGSINQISYRRIGKFRPVGMKVASDVFQLFTENSSMEDSQIRNFSKGLDLFEKGDWAGSISHFHGTEDPAAIFLCDYMSSSRNDSFDGIIDMKSK